MKIWKNKILPLFMAAAMTLAAFLPVAFAPAAVSAEQMINVDTTYDGALAQSESVNQYYFTLTSPGSVNIQFTTPTGITTNSWRVRLYDPGQTTNLQANDFGASGVPSQYDNTKTEAGAKIRLPAGSYYIEISSVPNMYLATTYSFSVKFTAENSEYEREYNDTKETATSLVLNSYMIGNIGYASDVDWFKVVTTSYGGISISFSTLSITDAGSWVVILYDKNEKQFQSEQVGYGGTIIGTQRVNTLSKLRLPPGTYYIKIMPYSASNISFSEYKITANFTAENTNRYEKEFNDTKETATAISLNGSVKGNLNSGDDNDYFSLEVFGNETVKIKFETPESVTQNLWTIYLMNDKGAVNTYTAGQTGVVLNSIKSVTFNPENLQEGKYYIVVYASNSRSYPREDYTLTVVSDTAPTSLEVEDIKTVNYNTTVPPSVYGVNNTVQGQLKNSADTNKFDFGLPEKGVIALRFQTPDTVARQSWTASVYDANDNLLYTEKFGSTGETSNGMRTKESNRIRVPAGTYYVLVSSATTYEYSTVMYNITVLYSTEPSSGVSQANATYLYESEFNNTAQIASSLNIAENYYTIGNLSDSADQDYYKVTLDKSGSLQVNFATSKAVSQNNWVVRVYASDAKTLLQENIFGADGTQDSIDSALKTTNSSKMRLTKGTYYIYVGAYSNINYSNADYRINATYTAESADAYEQEYNNKAENANTVMFNTNMTGNITNADDVDYYKVTAEKTSTIQIRFSVDTKVNGSYWYIKVYDTQLKELKSYKIGEGGTVANNLRYFKTEIISVAPGAYYIAIGSYSKNEYSNEDYIIKFLDDKGQKIDSALSVAYPYTADRPSAWAKEEVELANAYGLIPQGYMKNFTDNITREEFCKLTMQFITTYEEKSLEKVLEDNNKTYDISTFTDTTDSVILSAYALGIIKGRGNGIFDPAGKITREEAAIMLTRLGTLLNIKSNTTPLTFKDKDKFWAESVNAIGYVSACLNDKEVRVMQGDQNGNFNPKDSYTKEQSYLTMIRLFFVK